MSLELEFQRNAYFYIYTFSHTLKDSLVSPTALNIVGVNAYKPESVMTENIFKMYMIESSLRATKVHMLHIFT